MGILIAFLSFIVSVIYATVMYKVFGVGLYSPLFWGGLVFLIIAMCLLNFKSSSTNKK